MITLFHRRLFKLAAGGAFGLAASLPMAALADGDPACEPMFESIMKMLQTPNHQFMTQSSPTAQLTNGGRMLMSESITTHETSYVKYGDQWRKVPFTPEEMMQRQQESRKTANEKCRFLRDDTAEGDAAVYEAKNTATNGSSQIEIWISKANGLPLREEIDLDLGDTGKSHSSVRFDYEHVEAPKDPK